MPTVQVYAPILQIVQDTCRLLSLNVPSAVYGSKDETAILLGAQANFLGPMILGDPKWQEFRAEFSITGDGVETKFPVPAGYESLTNETGWSNSMLRQCRLVNAQEWAALRASLSTFTLSPVFRLMNNNFEFLTPPALGEIITFEYTTSNWVQDGTNASLQKGYLTQDTDIPLLDSLLFTIGLKIKWRETKGFDTNADARDFVTRMQQVLNKDQPAQILSLNGGMHAGVISGANLPSSGYGL